MKLESQVCSLELAQKIKELGVKQRSIFFWDLIGEKWSVNYETCLKASSEATQSISAFTVAELGELLPDQIKYNKSYGFLRITKNYEGQYAVRYVGEDVFFAFQWENTEADARAKMLVYLIENKLMEV